MSPGARLLLVAGEIHTLHHRARGRAILVEGARIAWIGAAEAAPPADAVVDLGAAVITPAFVDAHVHATATGLAEDAVDLTGATSAAECLERLRRHVAEHPDRVVLGGPWDDFGWPEGRPPTAAEVAQAAPDRTVVLTRVDAHSCVVDQKTLARLPVERLAGVDRDDHGEPTGWLREEASQAAQVLVRALLPAQQLARARRAACHRAAALGIATLHEMGHPGLSGLDDARTWARGEWGVEVLVWWAELDADAGPANGLRPGGDLFLDGSIGSHTAALSVPYADIGGTGELFFDDDAVSAFLIACTGAGMGAGVHAIGDRAIEQACVALEAAVEVHGVGAVRACRHRVEHLELPQGDHLRRLGRLGVVASVQPAFDRLWGGSAGLYAQRFGARRACASNPFREIVAAGMPMAFGSDSTVTPLDPWGGVLAAERHRGGHGIDRRTALAAHTLGGRYAAGQDDAGPLAAGMRADLAVWDRDPLGVQDPTAVRCLATMAAGHTVHGDLPSTRAVTRS